MIDGEALINRLEELKVYLREQRANVSFGSDTEYTLYGYQLGVSIVIELLKKQEAVEPKLVGVNTWTCGECGALIGWEEFAQSGLELVKYKFCAECGKAVKWDG